MAQGVQQTEDVNANNVYQQTTTAKVTNGGKKKHRDKSDLGDDFVAPDGGWGWFVCVAAGLSNVS